MGVWGRSPQRKKIGFFLQGRDAPRCYVCFRKWTTDGRSREVRYNCLELWLIAVKANRHCKSYLSQSRVCHSGVSASRSGTSGSGIQIWHPDLESNLASRSGIQIWYPDLELDLELDSVLDSGARWPWRPKADQMWVWGRSPQRKN